MELIDDDAKKSNIEFVKINDKRFGKSFGIKKFPALTFCRGREVMIFEGDMKVFNFIDDVNITKSYIPRMKKLSLSL